MKKGISFFVTALTIAACGSTDLIVGGDASTTDGGGKDGSGNGDGGGTDGASTDSGGGTDGGPDFDAAVCMPPGTMCATSCPSGTVCLIANGPVQHDLGCTTIPPGCDGTCACMAPCFCPQNGINKCMPTNKGLACDNGAVSRRELKKDIDYVTDEEREALAQEALSIPLATYRYKVQPDDAKKHLGFIIDDQPESSPAVQADRMHVDEYGYTSMLLATVQEQQRQIDALNKKVEALEHARKGK